MLSINELFLNLEYQYWVILLIKEESEGIIYTVDSFWAVILRQFATVYRTQMTRFMTISVRFGEQLKQIPAYPDATSELWGDGF